MCICPPIWPPIWRYRETLARLTPFWTARRQVDEIIERDRRLIRTSPGSEKKNERIGFSVDFSNGFYYVWFQYPTRTRPIFPTCIPIMFICPDYIVQKCKLRRDQIEYMERKIRRRQD